MPENTSELIRVLSGNMGGRSVFEMSQLYQPLAENFVLAVKNTQGIKLEKLVKKFPEYKSWLMKLKQSAQANHEQVILLPVQGSSKNIIIIFDKNAGLPIGHLLVDPWNL